MPDDTIQVPPGLTTDGLIGRRYMARCIDSILITVILVAAWGLVAAFRPPFAGITLLVFGLFLSLIIWIGYGTALEASPWQATIGKRLMGLRVYNSQGGRPAFLQAGGRNLLKDGPFLLLGFIPGLGFLSLIWLGAHVVVLHRSPVYQAIHDRAAHTWVAAAEATIQLHLS
jgi:uncharacterized RDD family membrane protein YckC